MLSEVRGKQRHGNVKETRDGDVREREREGIIAVEYGEPQEWSVYYIIIIYYFSKLFILEYNILSIFPYLFYNFHSTVSQHVKLQMKSNSANKISAK